MPANPYCCLLRSFTLENCCCVIKILFKRSIKLYKHLFATEEKMHYISSELHCHKSVGYCIANIICVRGLFSKF